MRSKVILAFLLFWGVASQCQNIASPYSNSVFKAQTFTATGQTGAIIQLNGLIVPSTIGSSFASGTITLTGTSLTTLTFSVMGSSDNGATYYALPIYVAANPTATPTTTVTATANGLYQINLAGLTHVKFVTSGTFTATSVSLVLTASPNAMVSRSSGGGGGSVTAAAMQSAMTGQTGCTTAGNAWNPATNTCIPSGGGSSSPVFKYVSQLGCAQNADLNKAGLTPSGGSATEDTTCINTALATATAAAPIYLIQDGASLVCRIHGPVTGNWHIVGQGGGVARVFITAYSISGNVVTFTTKAQNLVAGQLVTLGAFPTSTFFNSSLTAWTQVRVLSSGLTSTQFQANFTHANVTATTEAGEADYLHGTGFVQKAGCNDDVINNYEASATYNVAVPQYGSNVGFAHFIINGNRGDGTTGNSTSGFPQGPMPGAPQEYSLWYSGINISATNGVSVDDVWITNTSSFNFKCNGCNDVHVTKSHFEQPLPNIAMNAGNGDGVHIDGPANNITVSDSYFRTTDDPMGLAGAEGYCGKISNFTATNNVNDGSLSFGRAYSGGGAVTCANGNTPNINTLTLSNWSGYVSGAGLQRGFIIGLPEANQTMSLANGVTGFKWTNSVITAPFVVVMSENIGTVETSNLEWTPTGAYNTAGGDFMTQSNAITVGSITMTNVTHHRIAAFSTSLASALDTVSGVPTFGGTGAGSATIGRFAINGYKDVDDGSYTGTNPIFNIASPSTIGNFTGASTIDFTNVANASLASNIAQVSSQPVMYVPPTISLAVPSAAGITFSNPTSVGSVVALGVIAPNLAAGQHVVAYVGENNTAFHQLYFGWFKTAVNYGSVQTYAGHDPISYVANMHFFDGGPVSIGIAGGFTGASLPTLPGTCLNVGTTSQMFADCAGHLTVVSCTGCGGSGSNPSSGTQGVVNAAGLVAGTFQATSITDNGTNVISTEPAQMNLPGTVTTTASMVNEASLASGNAVLMEVGKSNSANNALYYGWFNTAVPYGSLQTFAKGNPVELAGSQVWLNGGPVYVGNASATGATQPSGGGLFNVGTTNQFQVSSSGAVTTGNGFTGTKTAGTCVFTIVSGIITNVTGC